MNKVKNSSFYSRYGIVIVLLVALYFVVSNALNYFNLNEEAYGPYFWPRVDWVLPHVIFGVVALLTGPFQLSSRIRSRNLKLHKRLGYVYLISILLGAAAGIVLSLTSKVNLTYKTGLFFLAFAWLLTSGMALFFILKRKTTQHKEWMVRSYVVTFAFVFFRFGADTMHAYEVAESSDINALMSWASWAVPLLILEPILQYRKTFKRRSKK